MQPPDVNSSCPIPSDSSDDDKARNWILENYGKAVLNEVDRLRQQPQFAHCDPRDLLTDAFHTAHESEIEVLDNLATRPCDSSGVSYHRHDDVSADGN